MARAKGVASDTAGERPAIRRNELGVPEPALPTPAVTLARDDPEPALPTPTVTLVCGATEPTVPTPTGETLGRGGVASDDRGEGGVLRLAPTPEADGTGVLVLVRGVQGE